MKKFLFFVLLSLVLLIFIPNTSEAKKYYVCTPSGTLHIWTDAYDSDGNRLPIQRIKSIKNGCDGYSGGTYWWSLRSIHEPGGTDLPTADQWFYDMMNESSDRVTYYPVEGEGVVTITLEEISQYNYLGEYSYDPSLFNSFQIRKSGESIFNRNQNPVIPRLRITINESFSIIARTKSSLPEISKTKIIDMNGREISEGQIRNEGSEYEARISNLEKGFYLLSVETLNGIEYFKVVVM